MSMLQAFLNANPVDGLTDDVAVSERFKGPDGKLLKFKIRVMTDKEFESYRKQAMTITAGRKKGRQVEMDMSRFNGLMVINHTVDPNFKDASSIQAMGCTAPEEYLAKVLLPGEIVQLAAEIQRLSGFDRDMDELVDEAKN
jgi:hypothetical protein